MGSTLPLYLRIQQHLLDKIRSGEWAPHHQIPPEEQLAKDFGVSRMTANKAIRDLVQQGYLTRQPGVGTFVTDHKAESSLVEVHNIATEVASRGHDYSSQVLTAEALDAGDEVSMRLGVRLGTRVFHTLIIHRENGVPIQLEDRYVNPRRVPHYLDTDFARHTPNEVLEAACPISDVEHVVEAVLVDTDTAERLEIAPDQPCLRMIRRTWSGDHLVSYARLLHPGDRYKLRSSLHTA
ncbi:histidine utilization repressor [Halomonas sp. THAF12]|uniref:Histidine utilization repressor n=1 Tax=Halomonas organivorans TaxID=257772 RepID=A0A7W5BX01_9GAMM|nr:histidine utilization repressor [Halomonas organivorans]MBB3140711.1 GntR family histidine utilization transcriptional repressor [Halomonas organivorans]